MAEKYDTEMLKYLGDNYKDEEIEEGDDYYQEENKEYIIACARYICEKKNDTKLYAFLEDKFRTV